MEIGEFVRSKDGRIGNIIQPKGEYFDKKLINITKEISANVFIDYGEIIEYCKKTEIKKHSKNIVDLIEINDIVHTRDVFNYDYCYMYDESFIRALKEDIKNGIRLVEILTHEQYEKNCYKMEEEE